jgi:hypothetical protein
MECDYCHQPLEEKDNLPTYLQCKRDIIHDKPMHVWCASSIHKSILLCPECDGYRDGKGMGTKFPLIDFSYDMRGNDGAIRLLQEVETLVMDTLKEIQVAKKVYAHHPLLYFAVSLLWFSTIALVVVVVKASIITINTITIAKCCVFGVVILLGILTPLVMGGHSIKPRTSTCIGCVSFAIVCMWNGMVGRTIGAFILGLMVMNIQNGIYWYKNKKWIDDGVDCVRFQCGILYSICMGMIERAEKIEKSMDDHNQKPLILLQCHYLKNVAYKAKMECCTRAFPHFPIYNWDDVWLCKRIAIQQ